MTSPSPSPSRQSSRSALDSSDNEAELDNEDGDQSGVEQQEWEEPPTPPGTPPPEVIRQQVAAETTNNLFRTAKLRINCPPRWSRLFLHAAEQIERRFAEKREMVFMAVAQDDVEMLIELKKQITPDLFDWWGYDLDLVVRASTRYRADIVQQLPALFGTAYPGHKKVSAVRMAMDHVPPEGSRDAVLEQQRGTVLVGLLRDALEKNGEINVRDPLGLEDALNAPINGPWQTTDAVCAGINWGTPVGVYAGWRAVHFVASCVSAVKTAVPALKLLFSAKADAMRRDAGGASALHMAALRGHTRVVQVLLDHGADLEAEDLFGCSAFNIAARARHYPFVRTMVLWLLPSEVGQALFHTEADRISEHYSLANGLKLFNAASAGNIETVKELARQEPPETADVNFVDPSGRRPVHVATGCISNEHVACDMLKALVGLKADINVQNLHNETPLHIAARMGRALACKTILLLHAHPSLLDIGNRTPLMLAAAGPAEQRTPPAYNGVLTNSAPLRWTTVQDILDWNGRGDAPIINGPEPRRVRGPVVDKVNALLGTKNRSLIPENLTKKKQKDADEEGDEEDEEYDDEEEEDDDDEDDKKGYHTVNDTIMSRANAVCELGFDDQYIVDVDGRVNRGDRIQLFGHLFNPERDYTPKFAGDRAPLVPNEQRCKFLWNHLTGPLLAMEQQSALPPRPSQLLSYLLRVMLGSRGPAFGVLFSNAFDTAKATPWASVEAALKLKDLGQRCETLKVVGFQGAKPHLTKWSGSVWEKNKYPRYPNLAPWGAFEFVDRDDPDHPPLVLLQKHDKYNIVRKSSGQAFKDNARPIFQILPEGSVPSGRTPPTSCTDSLILANRIYCNETVCVRKQVETRACLVGERLLCPLLQEFMAEVETDGVASENKLRLELLEYLKMQMVQPEDCFVFVNEPRRPYKDTWEDVVERAIKILNTAPNPAFRALGPQGDDERIHHMKSRQKLKGAISMIAMATSMKEPSHSYLKTHKHEMVTFTGKRSLTEHQPSMPQQSMAELTKNAPPGDYDQFALLSTDDKRWLLQSQSVRAFVELKRVQAISTVAEYSSLVSVLSRGGLQDFHGRFWRATFGLWLWGRAQLLKPILELEIRRRLSESFLMLGPKLRPKIDMLEICALALQANEERATMASEPPWMEKPKGVFAELLNKNKPPRKPLDHNAGYPDAGVKNPTGIALFSDYKDVLCAQVICNDAKSMRKALEALTGPPCRDITKKGRLSSLKFRTSVSGTKGKPDHIYMNVQGREGRTRFQVISAHNSFREEPQKVIPATASVTLTCDVGWVPLGYGKPLDQLVRIELILRSTLQARWLAGYLDLKPTDMPRPKEPDEEESLGLRRRR